MNRALKKLGTGFIFAGTIFLGAFLLFQVQPLIGRFLLPWFGGTPEVWTTCMLFFQVFLLGGYVYAHFLMRMENKRLGPVIHIGLLAIALLFLPIVPKDVFKPTTEDHPIMQILLICTATVGLPYLLLSATSPLIQVWYSRAFGGRNPYRLYALSNTGSLLALASFPFVFEPLMTRVQTAHLWSALFAVFALACAGSALLGKNHTAEIQTVRDNETEEIQAKPALSKVLLWLALPAGASVELLAVTNKITQDIAVVPFLWVLPLALYLLSFIICFEHQRWYQRWLWIPLFIAGIGGVIYSRLTEQGVSNIRMIVGVHVFMLFCCCMVCHGELYRLRPRVGHLTLYYLMIAAGGAMGGFFVAVVCPLIFNVYIELYLGLLACALFLLLAEEQEQKTKSELQCSKLIQNKNEGIAETIADSSGGDSVDTIPLVEPRINVPAKFRIYRRRILMALLLIAGAVGILFMGKRSTEHQIAIANSRNFFGVLTIYEEAKGDPDQYKLLMQHGTTFHGLQFQSKEKRDIPTAYYSPDSGIGLVMEHYPKQENRRIGIVGLGVGTIAIYGKDSDFIRFYEINPEVERLARKYFTYLDDSAADVEVVIGDARLTMENEPPQGYDVLVLDAFSSDSVPIHLLTVEAMEVYLKHLAPDGVLAFHISSMHLDLKSVLWRLARHLELNSAWIECTEDDDEGAMASDWILLARNDTFLASKIIDQNDSRPYRTRENISLWTDDHVNLLEILKKNPLER